MENNLRGSRPLRLRTPGCLAKDVTFWSITVYKLRSICPFLFKEARRFAGLCNIPILSCVVFIYASELRKIRENFLSKGRSRFDGLWATFDEKPDKFASVRLVQGENVLIMKCFEGRQTFAVINTPEKTESIPVILGLDAKTLLGIQYKVLNQCFQIYWLNQAVTKVEAD